MAAQPVLGVSEVRPPLLDHLPITTRRRARRASGPCRCGQAGCRVIFVQVAMNTSPSADDEDDEVFDDQEFDEDSDSDEDDEDTDPDDEEEEETWQVVAA